MEFLRGEKTNDWGVGGGLVDLYNVYLIGNTCTFKKMKIVFLASKGIWVFRCVVDKSSLGVEV